MVVHLHLNTLAAALLVALLLVVLTPFQNRSSFVVMGHYQPHLTMENGDYSHKPVFIGDDALKAFDKEDQHVYPVEYEGHFSSLLLSHADIRRRVQQLASMIHGDYKGKRPLLVCTLKGACPFFIHLCDALQELRQGFDMEFVRASSYEGTSTTGKVHVTGIKVESSLLDRHVILIEDIIDTGTTLAHLIPHFQEHGKPSSIKVCSLLQKRLGQSHDSIDEERMVTQKIIADYVGFSIPNHFIIGYGLDYNELYRDLADIFVISQAGIEFDATQLYKNNDNQEL